jgi:triacylglycerol lipase
MLARRLKWGLVVRLTGSALVGAGLAGHDGKGWILVSLLVFLLADAPLLGLAYVLSRRSGAPVVRGAKTDFFRGAAAALREWAAFTTFYVVVQPFEHFWMGDDSCVRAPSGALPVVLAHGYCCNRGIWLWIRSRLRAAGFPVATVNFEPVFGDIEIFTEQLRARIDSVLAETGAPNVVIATHSMGGLVARAYLRRHGEEKVAALVTVGSPHYGTRLAFLAPGRNARQMEPGNGWLNELNATTLKIPVTTIEGAGDEIIAPQNSALWPGADQRILPAHDHFGLILSDQVASIIRDAARSASVAEPKNTSLSSVA